MVFRRASQSPGWRTCAQGIREREPEQVRDQQGGAGGRPGAQDLLELAAGHVHLAGLRLAGGGVASPGAVVSAGVVAPEGACVDVLACRGGVVETEGVGDDGGGDLQDELAQRGSAGGAHGQAVVAELVAQRHRLQAATVALRDTSR